MVTKYSTAAAIYAMIHFHAHRMDKIILTILIALMIIPIT